MRAIRTAVLACAFALLLAPAANSINLPAGFQESVVFSGLNAPTNVKFSPDGRIFVAEKDGRVLVYSGLGDSTPTVFANLSTKVYDAWDRGLLGLALDPAFPDSPYVYVLYTHDAAIGGQAPRWGDQCPSPPGVTEDGCVVSGRLSRLEANGDAMTGPEQVLVEGWCQQYPSHSIGDIQFDADGALYASGGDGASFTFADFGQAGDPLNPCGDPPVGAGGVQSPPTAEGGALRSQDLRSEGDPVGLNGSIIRVDRATGQPWPTNPRFLDADPNARRILAHGFRNPYRFIVDPDGDELWVGDVGWYTVDEINRIPIQTSQVRNFGWPCYEGIEPQYDYEEIELDLCEDLYAEPGAVTPPFFAYGDDTTGFPSGCYEGGVTLAGLAFYGGSSYPGYGGSLFVADYARKCIWLLRPGDDGSPDANSHEVFATAVESPVDLEIGPGGDLYYVDLEGGKIRRLRYAAGNSPPTAVAVATPPSGSAPLMVTLDASGSTDPDVEELTFAWDLDEDGQFDDAFEPTIQRTYTTRGRYTVRVRVTDSLGEFGTASVVVGVDVTPPVAQIDVPTAGTTWRVGDVVTFSGLADDADEGALPPSALKWRLLLQHCPAGCHAHIVQTWDGVSGDSFAAPDHEYPSYLELELTATDSDGSTDTVVRRLDPQLVELTFASSPIGFELVFGGHRAASPFGRTVIVGSRTTLTAPSPQSVNGHTFYFGGWSDGGARSHEVVAPAGATTYTADFDAYPVASDDAYSVGEDGTLVVDGVLDNDTDPDSATLTAILAGSPGHGTLDLRPNGSFTYIPSPNFGGTDTFSYRASDGSLDSNAATVTITVNAVNDAPVAADNGYATKQNIVLAVPAPGVLGNDADIEGGGLRASTVNGPASGALTLNADGSFVYKPNANTVGTVSFTYKANDGTLDSAPARVTINVTRATRTPQRARCVVPKLFGRTLSAARRSLARAHCALGRVYRIYSTTPTGRVRSQNPRAGRRLPNRAKVALVVSRGRKR